MNWIMNNNSATCDVSCSIENLIKWEENFFLSLPILSCLPLWSPLLNGNCVQLSWWARNDNDDESHWKVELIIGLSFLFSFLSFRFVLRFLPPSSAYYVYPISTHHHSSFFITNSHLFSEKLTMLSLHDDGSFLTNFKRRNNAEL